MKTIIVLCSLVAFATAIPAFVHGSFDELESTNGHLKGVKREKKSPLHEVAHEDVVDDEAESAHLTAGSKSHVVAPVFEGRSLGFKKPLIIKKKLDYHLYRDSDEEMTYADPHEKCRKQVKVKVCDDGTGLNSNKISKTLASARLGGHISDREVEYSIKMAKEAVENLQRDIKKMEESSAKLKENPRTALAAEPEIQQDIEDARLALEHVSQNFENLESMEVPRAKDVLPATDEERHARWNEAIENIHRNFEIARNIEDAFRAQSLDSIDLDNGEINKLTGSENLHNVEHQIQEKSTDELLSEDKNSIVKDVKGTDDENIDFISKVETGKSSTPEELQIDDSNDMFTATTNNKEFKLELHSDSLKQEKSATDNVHSETLTPDEARTDENKLQEHLPEMKNVDVISEQSEVPDRFNHETNIAKNAFSEFTETDIEKEKESVAENQNSLAKEANTEMNLNIDNLNKEHDTLFKSSESRLDQIHTDTKMLSDDENIFIPKEALKESENGDNVATENKEHNDELEDKNSESFLREVATNEHTIKENKMVSTDEKQVHSISNHLGMLETEHQNIGRLVTDKDEIENDSLKRLAQAVMKDYTTEQEKALLKKPEAFVDEKQKSAKMSAEENIGQLTGNSDMRVLTQNIDDESFKNIEGMRDNEMSMRTMQDQNTAQSLTENHQLLGPQNMHYRGMKEETENMNHQLKSASDFHFDFLPATDLRNQQKEVDASSHMRMFEDKNVEHGVTENIDLQRPHLVRLAQTNEQKDYMLPSFKASSAALPSTKTDLLEHGQKVFNENPMVRMTEDQSVGQQLMQHRNLHALQDRWANNRQRMDHHTYDFKNAMDSHNGHLLTPLTTPSGQHSLKEQTNMRISEVNNFGQQFHNNRELQDVPSMSWNQDKLHKHHMSQQFNNVPEFHNNHLRPHLHQHGFMHRNRFSNQYDMERNSELPSLSSKTHDHVHLEGDGKLSDLDSTMQPSNHIIMRDNGPHWGPHHGMARSSYGSGLPLAGVSSGAVGVFPNANSGCGIPLMLSCSPSVVSGSLAKTHPAGIAAPAYRSDDDMMFYRKRDTKNTNETPVKIQKTPFYHKTDLTLNKH